MKTNVFYTYLTFEEDENGIRYYGVYYNIDLPGGWFTDTWEQNVRPVKVNGTVVPDTYMVSVAGRFGNEKHHLIELNVSRSISADNISKNGVLRVYGLGHFPQDRWFKEAITLRTKGGPTTGNGSTKHMGDADG